MIVKLQSSFLRDGLFPALVTTTQPSSRAASDPLSGTLAPSALPPPRTQCSGRSQICGLMSGLCGQTASHNDTIARPRCTII